MLKNNKNYKLLLTVFTILFVILVIYAIIIGEGAYMMFIFLILGLPIIFNFKEELKEAILKKKSR